MATIKGINVGLTTIYASYGGKTATAPLEVVAKSIADASVTVTFNKTSFTYNGSTQIPTVTVKDGTTTLVEGTDYRVTYPNPSVNAGTYTVTIEGIGNYGSSRNKSYTINKTTMSVTAYSYSGVYDGASHSSTVKVTSSGWDGKTIVYGSSTSYGTNATTAGVTNTAYAVKTATNYTASTTIYYKVSGGTNYNDYTGSVTFEIPKRPINVTASTPAAKTYDGTALTSNSATAEPTGTDRGLVSGHTMTSCTVTGSQTLAGTSANVPSAAVIKSGTTTVTDNYNITYINGELPVIPMEITATATNQSKTYDGTKLNAENTGSVNETLPTNHTIIYSCTGSIGPNVSSGTKTLSSVTIKNGSGTDVTSSFDVHKVNGTLKINARAITFKADDQSKTYDGTALTAENTATRTGGNTLVSGHTTEFTCSGSQTNGGSSTKELVSVTIMDGSNNVTSNYSITKNNGTLTVNKATMSVTEYSYSGTYDGASHSSTVKVTSSGWDGKTIVYGSSTSYGTNATTNGAVNTAYAVKTATNYTASTTIYYKVSGGTNYNDHTGSVTFEIKKKDVTVTAGSSSRAYNGSALTNNTATPTGLLSTHHLHSWTNTGSQTTVGSSANVPSAAEIYSGSHSGTESASNRVTDNYKINYVNGTLTVTAAAPVVSITGVPSGTIYDGSAHYVKAVSTSKDASNNTVAVPGTLYWKKVTPVGGTASPASSTNKTGSMTLNGTSAVNVTNAYVTNNSDDFDFYWQFVPTDTTNYSTVGGTASNKVSAIIDPKNATNLTATATSLTYNSSPQTFTVTVKDGTKTLTAGTDYTISGNIGTNAGTYNITITGINNYTSTKEIPGIINKADVTITPTVASKTYDGTALTPSTATADTQPNDHLHTYTLGGSQTNVGESYATVSAAKIYRGSHSGTESTSNDATSNYNITYANTTSKLVVNKRNITITAGSDTKVYDGTPLTKNTSTQSGMVSGQTYTCTITGSQTTVGTSANVPSAAVIKSGTTTVTDNYNITYVNGSLPVTARAITFTADDETKKYDGSVLRASNTATRTGGYTLVSGHTAVFTCSGETADANAGTTAVKTLSSVTIKDGSNNDVTSNYSITKNNGTLSITRLDSLTKPTKVNTSSPTFTYNGSERTGINNYSQTGMSVAASPNNVYKATNAGTYSFKATPDSNHAWKDGTYGEVSLSWNIGNATNNVAYTGLSGVYKYCTEDAKAANVTDAIKTVGISTNGVTSTTNKTTGSTAPTCSLVSVNGSTVPTGWSISSDGKTLTIPANTAAGTYTVKVRATAPAITNYNVNSVDVNVNVEVTEVILTGLALTLNSNSITYGSSTTPKSLVATYSNTKTTDVSASANYTSDPTGYVTIDGVEK